MVRRRGGAGWVINQGDLSDGGKQKGRSNDRALVLQPESQPQPRPKGRTGQGSGQCSTWDYVFL